MCLASSTLKSLLSWRIALFKDVTPSRIQELNWTLNHDEGSYDAADHKRFYAQIDAILIGALSLTHMRVGELESEMAIRLIRRRNLNGNVAGSVRMV